jgi:hypothetical protein
LMRKEPTMPRQMRAVLGAGLLAMAITSSHAWAAADPGYSAVQKVGNCAEKAKKTFHKERRDCRDHTQRGKERERCYEDTTVAYFHAFDKCYDLAETYDYE